MEKETPRNGMTATTQFIEDAIKGGLPIENIMLNGEILYPNQFSPRGVINMASLLLDPLAWQAVGKTRGWSGDEVIGDTPIAPKWLWNWHRFIDRLASGDTIEEALQAIH